MTRGTIFLVVAFGVGLGLGSIVTRMASGPESTSVPDDGGSESDGPADPADGAPPSMSDDSTTSVSAEEVAAPLREEIGSLRQRVTELEGELEQARVRLAASGDGGSSAGPEADDAAEADFEAEFAELVKGGLGAYAGEGFRKFIEELAGQGPEAHAFLYDLLSSSGDASTRFLAAAALEGIGDPAAIPALEGALADEQDLLVRRMASHAIAVLGTEGALEPLRKSMQADPDWGVRVNSAYGVAKAGGKDGLDYLEAAYLSEDTPDEYLLAILGGLADVAAPSSAPLFRKILRDTKDPGYLLISIAALKEMKDQSAIPDLERIVDSDLPESIRNAAAEAIEALK